MKKLILFLAIFLKTIAFTQINEQFSSTVPDPTIWTSTSSSWELNHNYGAGNAYSGAYCARLASASSGNGKYLYIKVNVTQYYPTTLTFWSKRFCDLTILVNDAADQSTPIKTTNISAPTCSNTWYQQTFTVKPQYTGVMYFQILCTTVFGGPTSIYIDDVVISSVVGLPVELVSFNGSIGNKLEWITASEHNNDYFTLERSTDGTEYVTIKTIRGAGDSRDVNSYVVVDGGFDAVINYYRLKQTDYDGVTKYSQSLSIDNRQKLRYIIKCVDMLGKTVSIDTPGIVIVIYDDGDIVKLVNE